MVSAVAAASSSAAWRARTASTSSAVVSWIIAAMRFWASVILSTCCRLIGAGRVAAASAAVNSIVCTMA
jgi:hypothetical protein